MDYFDRFLIQIQKDLLPQNNNINYIKLNERHSIGEKRNIGVKMPKMT